MKTDIPKRTGGTEAQLGGNAGVLGGTPEMRVGALGMVELGMDTRLGSWGFWVGGSVAMPMRGRASCGVEAA